MTLYTTKRFDRDYALLPEGIKETIDSKLTLFISNARHPSLRIKKMQAVGDVWEMRITDTYRVTFNLDNDTAILRRVGTHDILRNP